MTFDRILYLPLPVTVGHIVFVLGLAAITSPFWGVIAYNVWKAER